MYTEIEISEFSIRARLKLGDMSEDISTKLQHGIDVDQLIADSAALRIFLNSVNSDFKQWTNQELYKRMEYFTDLYDLVDAPRYSTSWLDKFKAVPSISRVGGNYTNLPKTGEGFVYLKEGEISLVIDNGYTLNDLPEG